MSHDEYDDVWIVCRCGNKLGGTIVRDERFEFHCSKCQRMWLGTILCYLKDE